MPQNNIFLNFVQKVAGSFVQKPALLDANQSLYVNIASGSSSQVIGTVYTQNGSSYAAGITAAGGIVKTGAGRVSKVSVIATGTYTGSIYDGTSAGGVLIATIPAAIGLTSLDYPIVTGIFAAPGTGQTVSVSFE